MQLSLALRPAAAQAACRPQVLRVAARPAASRRPRRLLTVATAAAVEAAAPIKEASEDSEEVLDQAIADIEADLVRLRNARDEVKAAQKVRLDEYQWARTWNHKDINDRIDMQYRQAVSTIESGIYVVDKILVESKIEKGSRETALQLEALMAEPKKIIAKYEQ